MSKIPSAIRLSAAILGFASGLVSASHAHAAFEIEAPMGTVVVLVVVALLKIAAGVQFAAAPSRRGDAAFLFLFGIAAVVDLGRFSVEPLKFLLVTPAALLAGGVTLWAQRRKRGQSEPQI